MRSYDKMDDSELERLLIQSARLDSRSAPPAVRRRILAAAHPFVGAASAAGALTASRALASVAPKAIASSATASLKLMGGALIVKCTIGGLFAGAVAAGAYHMATSASVAPRAAQTSTAEQIASLPSHARQAGENRDSSRAASTDKVSSLERPKPVEVGLPIQATTATASHENAPSRAGPSRISASVGAKRGSFALGAEVAMLDRARAALSAGNAALAIHVLDDYKKSFHDGHLLPEATYMRVQALLKTGNLAAARGMAAHAQATWPDSPLSKELGVLVKPEEDL